MAGSSWAESQDETALTPGAGAGRDGVGGAAGWGGRGYPLLELGGLWVGGAARCWGRRRATSPPTGLPPPTRICFPRQQPEGRLLHQWQHHRQVPVLR